MKRRFLTSLIALLLAIGTGAIGVGAAQAAPSDGTRDSSFAPVGVSAGEVNASVLDAQGRLVIGGTFTTVEGVARRNIARYLPDGTLDTGFAAGAGFDGTVRSLAIDASGNVVAGGQFTSYAGTSGVNRIARLTSTGALDTTFATGAGFDGTVRSLAIDASGNIVVGGEFGSYAGTNGVNRIARLAPTGSLDTAFTAAIGGGPSNPVLTLALDSTGRIVAGGQFGSFNGAIVNGIVRLTSTGNRDTTFATGAGFDGTVMDLAIDSRGRVVATGAFTSYAGSSANRIARLNSPVSVSYDLNGGSGTLPGLQTTATGGAVTIAAGTGLSRTGYTFAGWNTAANGSGTALTAGSPYTVTGPTTAYAQWTVVAAPNPNTPNPTPVPTPTPASSTVTLLGATGTPAGKAPVSLTAVGLLPGSSWTLTMHSSPVILATGTAPASGSVQASATLPAAVPPGAHRLVLTATAADGTTLTVETSFRVDTRGTLASTGTLAATGNDDAVPLAALGGLLLLAGTGALLVSRHRQH